MPKALAISGLAVAVVVLLVFGLDVAIGIPLGGMSKTMDIGFLVCALILGYISWTTFREQP